MGAPAGRLRPYLPVDLLRTLAPDRVASLGRGYLFLLTDVVGTLRLRARLGQGHGFQLSISQPPATIETRETAKKTTTQNSPGM
ncbi:hypothetical protein GCM10027456_79640 [Kineosporia babensis]